MTSKQIQEIYQYIQANGNFLGSQKILKEVEKHPDMIWELISKLCSKLKNKNIENAYAQMVYTLSEPEKHDRSSKWLKEYMDIRDLALKLGTRYLVLDYIKPEKDKIINLIARIVEVSKGVNFIKTQLDQTIVKDDLMTKEHTKFKALEDSTRNALTEITERKKTERPLYQQKVKIIENLHHQNSQKRQEKFQLLAKQKQLKDQIREHQKMHEDLKYQEENMLIRTQHLKNEIAQNAPEFKKQKRAVEEEYHKLEKEIHAHLELAKFRQSKIMFQIEGRRKYKGLINEQVRRLNDVFIQLEDSKLRFTKLKQENENHKHNKKNQFWTESNIKDQIKSIENQIRKSEASIESLQRQRQTLESQKRQLAAESTEAKDKVRQHDEKLKIIKNVINELAEKIMQQKKDFQAKEKELNDMTEQWMKMVEDNLNNIYRPIEEMVQTFGAKKKLSRKSTQL